MQITVSCQKCGKKLKAPPSLAGKRAKCSKCGAVMTIPDTSAADTAFELQVIEETSPAPRKPSAGKAGPGAGPSATSGPILTDDLLEPELPLTALVEHPDGQARGRNRGGRSKATIDPDAPPASTGMSAWDRVAAANAKRRDGDNGPRVWFSMLGIDFTTVKAVVLVVILGLIVGGITWWFTGPGDGLQMVQAQPVTRLVALASLSRQENKGIPNTMFKSGQSAPQANATPGPLGQKFPDELYNVGGGDRLIFTRPDPNGDYLLVHIRISERVAREEKLENRYDLMFGANNFMLHVGQQQIAPMLIIAPVESQSFQFPIGDARTHSYVAIIPADHKPTEIKEMAGDANALASGTLVFKDNPDVTGDLQFSSAYLLSQQPGVSGVYAKGKLTQNDPLTGTSLTYNYQGDEMTVAWNTQGKAWWSSDQYTRPGFTNPFAKVDLYLLYPRPQTSEAMVIKLNGNQVIATLPASLAAKAGQAPSTVAVGSAPAAVSATPSTPKVSTTGTQAMVDAANAENQQDAQAGSSGGKPGGNAGGNSGGGDPGFFDYFSALARARDMGKATVADNNLRQLGTGVLMYAEQNNGDLPPTMDHIRSVLGDINALLANARTGANPGYMYIPPGKNMRDIANPAGMPILYEIKDGKLDRHGAIMYLDGHIQPARK